MDVLYRSLSEAELAVARATDRKALADLSEEELEELHARVRRLRDKYVSQYRRQAASRVAKAGARGAARSRNARAAERAEVFEGALARVSAALAKAARQSAAQLRADRLAAAAEARSASRADRLAASTSGRSSSSASDVPVTRKRPPRKSTGGLKRDAATASENRRRQARRDAR